MSNPPKTPSTSPAAAQRQPRTSKNWDLRYKHCENCNRRFKQKRPDQRFCNHPSMPKDHCRKEFHKHGGAFRALRDQIQKLVAKALRDGIEELIDQKIRDRVEPILGDAVKKEISKLLRPSVRPKR